MEGITINIKRCKDCHHWEVDEYKYSTGHVDRSCGWCEYKGEYTNSFDACIDTSDLEKDMPYVLYADGADCRVVYKLW
jgi:hypothetical protein